MNPTSDILRGKLERLFELDDMKRLSTDLLGFDPESVGSTTGKGAFARALVDHCAGEDALEALADAILISKGKGAVDGISKAEPRSRAIGSRRSSASVPSVSSISPTGVRPRVTTESPPVHVASPSRW